MKPVKKEEAFDPGAAAVYDTLYGLPPRRVKDSRVVLIQVPWEATTSSGRGTKDGPKAILEASGQVDLFHRDLEITLRASPFHKQGIHLLEADPRIVTLNRSASRQALRIIERGGDIGRSRSLRAALDAVNRASALVNDLVYRRTRALIKQGKVVGIIGGDHSSPFGAIKAYAQANLGLCILHIDAHKDLRIAFEGFDDSHASIMNNVMSRLQDVNRLVQVGIRDFSRDEYDRTKQLGERVSTFFQSDLDQELHRGVSWSHLCEQIIAELPANAPIYVSCDIDGLDPVNCPGTGTPVPGGLSYSQLLWLLRALATNRRIVGFDLCEVGPGAHDGNVGARLLYHLIGYTLFANRRS